MIGSVLVVLLTTMIAFIAAIYAYGMSNLQEIKDNWVQYRCNPIYMPLAGMVGGDIGTNFTNCTLQSVNAYAGFVMDPLYSNFKILTDTINTILNSMNSIRGAVVGASEGFLGIIRSTYNKIQNTMSSTVQIVGRIRSIMNRMITTFAVLMNIVNTGIQTGQSVANGPIGQAAEFLCFSPHTRIDTEYGKIPMYLLEPGMKLKDGQRIQSVLSFNGNYTQMYYLGDVHVSGNHKVKHNNRWVRVEHHPDAKEAPICKILYCLNTEAHTIPIEEYVFKDYEETDNHDILTTFFECVQRHYGTHENPEKLKNPLKYRYTGIRPYVKVLDKNRYGIRADEVKIGDELFKGGKVIGIVKHRIDGCTMLNGIRMAPGTWVLESDGVHAQIEEKEIGVFTYYQFLTQNGMFMVRSAFNDCITLLDDQETIDEHVHAWRDLEIQKEET